MNIILGHCIFIKLRRELSNTFMCGCRKELIAALSGIRRFMDSEKRNRSTAEAEGMEKMKSMEAVSSAIQLSKSAEWIHGRGRLRLLCVLTTVALHPVVWGKKTFALERRRVASMRLTWLDYAAAEEKFNPWREPTAEHLLLGKKNLVLLGLTKICMIFT